MATKKPTRSTSKTAAAKPVAAGDEKKPVASGDEPTVESKAETKPETKAETKPETTAETSVKEPTEQRPESENAVTASASGSGGGSGATSGGNSNGASPDPRQAAYFAVGLGAIALIAALTVPLWGPRVYDDPLRQEIGSANEMLARVSEAVSELEAVVPELRAASEASGAKFAAIDSKIERVKLPAFLLAAGELRRALRDSRPFETELEVAITVTGDGTELTPHFEKIAGLAPVGVPTTRQLNRRFGEIARNMFLVSQVKADANLPSRALARLSAVAVQVRVKFLGERPGNDVAAIISRIQARIDGGNLPKAITELKTLPEAAQAVAAEWVADANDRIQVNEVHDVLRTLMMKRAVIDNNS